MQQENEDLRERLQVLEEYTGKDSLAEVQKLVREKRQLENRVKVLEQTSNNWNNFHKTREQFIKRSATINNQNPDGRKRATLNNTNDDDYEPVRPLMDTNEFSDDPTYLDNSQDQSTIYSKKTNMKSNSTNRVGVENKAFRVTTNQKNRNMNLIQQQRNNVNQNPARQKSHLKAPLPQQMSVQNPNSNTDRQMNKQIADHNTRSKTGQKFMPVERGLQNRNSHNMQYL